MQGAGKSISRWREVARGLGVLRSWEETYGVGERKLEELKAGGQGWVSRVCGPWPGGWVGFVLRESGSCWKVLSRKRT